jgi:carboxymethylenebutenolidase
MCFSPDAAPPIPEIRGAAVEHRNLTLDAADGNELMAFEALGDNPAGPAVVVLPDVRGLFHFYEELALRFAQHGFDSVAIDYFGRTAGSGDRSADFDFMPHVQQTTLEGVKQDVGAAVAHLRAAYPDRAIFTIGFCFGGSNSWHQAANGHGLAGAIGFYGHPTRAGFPDGAVSVVSRAGDMRGAILGLMGGSDPGIPGSEVDVYRQALDAAGIVNEIITYPNAPHSFFDRSYEQYADESADAWERVLGFIAEHG